ncbi:hypothetical protein QBC45DRAFT_434242 [Copromyces sp. CBS 386.78]|nr:hypothetical protein QBC45DRAFT_434242 [Copromyces sp. CBS 386.78]
MSYFEDAYFGDPNALPSQALGNNGYGDGEGGWDFGGNPAPVDDGTNWDEWLTNNLLLPGNDNSVQDNSVQDNSVQDNSDSDHCTCTCDGHIYDDSDVDNSVIANINPVPDNSAIDVNSYAFKYGFANPFNDNPVSINRIPRSQLHPGIGTSATGSWVPPNAFKGDWSIDFSPTGNSVVGNPAVVAGSGVVGGSNSVVAGHFVGNPIVGNNSVNGNANLATANQFANNPVTGPYVTSSNTYTAPTAQQMAFVAQQVEGYTQQQRHGVPGAAEGLAKAVAKLHALSAAQSGQAQARVPAAVTASTSSSAASSSSAPHPLFGVPSPLNQPVNNNAVTGNVVAGSDQAVPVSTTQVPAPAKAKAKVIVNTNKMIKVKAPRALPLLPPCLPHERFPFMKLPQELQLMIFRYVWTSSEPIPAPSDARTYQQQLQFYASPRHLRAQLKGLFKLGTICQEFRNVAYAEYFRSTQLYLRYETHYRWNYNSSFFGSPELNSTMNSFWDDDSPIKGLLEKHVRHVAWHAGPVYQQHLSQKMKDCLQWLKLRCRNIRTLEVIVGFRSAHVRPRHVGDLLAAKGMFAGGGFKEQTSFKFFRELHRRKINQLVKELRPKMKSGGCLEKVVFTVEPFVNESLRSYEQGTIDLKKLLEGSEWWTEFKKEVRKKLDVSKPVLKKKKIGERTRPYRIDQHLGHINPKWHKSYKI